MTKFFIDTNLYVRAFRAADAGAELRRFYAAFSPVCYLSSVVLHEVLIGARSAVQARAIYEDIGKPFRRTARVVAPSASAWRVAAETLAQLGWEEGLDRRSVPRSFVNDVLIAATCREEGLTVVTENQRDFRRIQRLVDLSFVPPWPA